MLAASRRQTAATAAGTGALRSGLQASRCPLHGTGLQTLPGVCKYIKNSNLPALSSHGDLLTLQFLALEEQSVPREVPGRQLPEA